jgi:hypothetical protein
MDIFTLGPGKAGFVAVVSLPMIPSSSYAAYQNRLRNMNLCVRHIATPCFVASSKVCTRSERRVVSALSDATLDYAM